MSDTLVTVENVSKKFCRRLRRSLWYGIKDLSSEIIGRSNHSKTLRKDEFWALKDVSFQLKRGDTLGLIGPNGAGKTTLLRLLNGLIKPDSGRIETKGRMQALIALGAGFNPILTGRENIYVNAAVLGIQKRQIDSKFDEIVEFSGIEEFIDAPVQSYSSGMAVRLGFSVAAHMEPDILLVDEVLAVGDFSFQTKCMEKISKLKEADTSIIIVSHNLDLIYNICRRAIYLDKGKEIFQGKTLKAMEKYIDSRSNIQIGIQNKPKETHNKRIGINRINLQDGNGIQRNKYLSGQKVVIQLEVYSEEKIRRPVFGVSLHRSDGVYVASFNSKVNNFYVEDWEGSGYIKLVLDSMPLTEGVYSVSAAITLQDSLTSYDYLPHGVSFRVIEDYSYKIIREHGVVRIPCKWEASFNKK